MFKIFLYSIFPGSKLEKIIEIRVIIQFFSNEKKFMTLKKYRSLKRLHY